MRQRGKERIERGEGGGGEDEAGAEARLKIIAEFWEKEEAMKAWLRREEDLARSKREKERNLEEHKKFKKEMKKKELRLRQSSTGKGLLLHNVAEESAETGSALQRRNLRKIEAYMAECSSEIRRLSRRP